jgi:hypothetical protein
MKRLFAALALAGFIAAPLAAQAEPPAPAAEETAAELTAKLAKLMKQASEEMEALEKELARTSLAAPKADVVAERMKEVRTRGGVDLADVREAVSRVGFPSFAAFSGCFAAFGRGTFALGTGLGRNVTFGLSALGPQVRGE